ncbi:lipopolysaccharide assembly protein LapA domain-containing protein [uncultured Alteromonas sp.]|uniref:lipopolysaccharide assembly protein LapA domain-containing protein n=1 Tax=uncultured Alteromonas sp. TaxID=179113 RepID=UPI0025DED7F8|nr:lipopolysaccharide assembly protein LapA domain-containing protein [uncultured Alteromonas sp.]
MKGLAFLLCIIAILVLAIAVGSQNDAVISVNYLIAKANMTVATLIAIALGLGVVVGVLAILSSWLTLRVKLMRAQAKLNKLQKE